MISKKNTLFRLLFLIVSLLATHQSFATHIVGGEMTYTCLGNNQYQITLTVFRDCYYGEPPFDNPASIGVFNSQGNFIKQLLLTFMGSDTLEPVLSGACFVVPPDVCVEETQYVGITDLPPITGGYILAYQRCCRNQTIVNIVEPLATGATYGISISQDALEMCNSSAVFNQWPPIFICVNEPIFFDQSGTDADGDSLVYHLCTPFQGADPDSPQPQPPNPPPYDEVVWASPYNVDDMLGGIPLAIDPVTGLLTGTPNTIGQFVVGICIDEYRNGVLISTTKRDFQFNVGVCGMPTAAFAAPAIQCGDLEVDFNNQSQNANTYQWYFDYPDNLAAATSQPEPYYTYPDTGLYTVALIIEPGTICADTFFQDIYLKVQSIIPSVAYDYEDCSDSLSLAVTDFSVDTLYDLVSWEWTLSNQNIILTSEEQNPVFDVGISGNWTLQLLVTSESGCTNGLTTIVPIDVITDSLQGDTISVCEVGMVQLNTSPDAGNTYLWSPAEGLSDPASSSPVAMPLETTTYIVTITNDDGSCVLVDSVTVIIPEQPLELNVSDDTVTCGSSIVLSASSNQEVHYTWSSDPDFTDVLGNEQDLTVLLHEQGFFYVLIEDDYGCFQTDSVFVGANGLEINVSDVVTTCPNDKFYLNVLQNLNPADSLTINWSPANAIISGQNSLDPYVKLALSDSFFVTITNQYGCTDSFNVAVMVDDNFYDLEIDVDPDTILRGDSSQLFVTPLDVLNYEWTPDSTLSANNIYNPVAYPQVTTEYFVEMQDTSGCVFLLSVVVVVVDNCKEPFIFIPNAFTPNGDGENEFWKVWGNNIEEIYILVYDRWGEKVFETTDPNQVWDGTYKNKSLESAAFGYYVRINCIGGQVFERKGNVSIIR